MRGRIGDMDARGTSPRTSHAHVGAHPCEICTLLHGRGARADCCVHVHVACVHACPSHAVSSWHLRSSAILSPPCHACEAHARLADAPTAAPGMMLDSKGAHAHHHLCSRGTQSLAWLHQSTGRSHAVHQWREHIHAQQGAAMLARPGPRASNARNLVGSLDLRRWFQHACIMGRGTEVGADMPCSGYSIHAMPCHAMRWHGMAPSLLQPYLVINTLS